MVDQEKFTIEDAHREFAKSSNGKVWTLLEKEKRSDLENQEMLVAAYASLYHWNQIGTNVHLQRGHWLLSHVLTALHQPENALKHALRCMELTESDKDSFEDFDIAYAHESLARAYALQGRNELAKDHFNQARKLGELIEDEEDKRIFMDDLVSGVLNDDTLSS
jgi:tetratricopeptide (TPR) repeat protein